MAIIITSEGPEGVLQPCYGLINDWVVVDVEFAVDTFPVSSEFLSNNCHQVWPQSESRTACELTRCRGFTPVSIKYVQVPSPFLSEKTKSTPLTFGTPGF